MTDKKKTAKVTRDQKRKQKISAAVKSLEKAQTKLEAGLKKLKQDLVMFRHYCD